MCFRLSKSHECPKKKVSIPHLELMATEMSVLIVALVKAELDIKIDSVTYWTDATYVLHCIKKSNLRPVPFVTNQLGKIHAF